MDRFYTIKMKDEALETKEVLEWLEEVYKIMDSDSVVKSIQKDYDEWRANAKAT